MPHGEKFHQGVVHTEDTHMRLVGIEKGRFFPILTCKHVLWVKALPDYEPLFSVLDKMLQDANRRFWIERMGVSDDNCGIEEDAERVVAFSTVSIILNKSLYLPTFGRVQAF